MRLAGRGAVEGGVERLLRAGLADRAGDAGNSSVCADTGSPAEVVQRLHGIGDMDVRLVDLLADDGAGGPCRESLAEKAMAVGRLPLHRDEKVAVRDLAGVERHAIRFKIAMNRSEEHTSELQSLMRI